jgi:hypothetical protein
VRICLNVIAALESCRSNWMSLVHGIGEIAQGGRALRSRPAEAPGSSESGPFGIMDASAFPFSPDCDGKRRSRCPARTCRRHAVHTIVGLSRISHQHAQPVAPQGRECHRSNDQIHRTPEIRVAARGNIKHIWHIHIRYISHIHRLGAVENPNWLMLNPLFSWPTPRCKESCRRIAIQDR